FDSLLPGHRIWPALRTSRRGIFSGSLAHHPKLCRRARRSGRRTLRLAPRAVCLFIGKTLRSRAPTRTLSVHTFGKGSTVAPSRGVTLVPALILVSLLGEKFLDLPKRQLLEALALSRDGLMAGRWWQLSTHALLHEGWLHLLANMIALWFAGRRLEPLLGT